MKKLFLMVAFLIVAGFCSQANAGVYVSFGGGGYCARGYPSYYGSPGYYYSQPAYYYGPRYYYGHRHYYYRNGVRVYVRF